MYWTSKGRTIYKWAEGMGGLVSRLQDRIGQETNYFVRKEDRNVRGYIGVNIELLVI